MKIKNPWQSATEKLLTKEIEDMLYAKASEDIENNQINKGIWTRAFAKAEGNESKQKAIYIELMVQHYKDEIAAGEEIEKILMSEAEKELARQAEENKKRQEAERKKQEEAAWNHPDAVAARAKAAEEQAKEEEAQSRVIVIAAWSLILILLISLTIFGKEEKSPEEQLNECLEIEKGEPSDAKLVRCLDELYPLTKDSANE